MGEHLTFLSYDKISDTIMYFSQNVRLNFVVSLRRPSKGKEPLVFHNEYKYQTNNGNIGYCIKRRFYYWFAIDNAADYQNNIMLQAKDIPILRMVFNDQILPWFMGANRIYKIKDNKLIFGGKYKEVMVPIDELHYMAFLPIIIDYPDGTSKEGIRITINNPTNIMDITIDKFMEFYYYIMSVDMYNAAISLLNYVKMAPYGVNMVDMINGTTPMPSYYEGDPSSGGGRNSFFDNL